MFSYGLVGAEMCIRDSLTLGRFEQTLDAAETPSDYAGQRIFYRSIRERSTDVLTVRDFLWRWDTDWFWCSRAFGVQRPLVRRLWPRRLKRSDVYQRIVGLENRHGVAAHVDSWRGRPTLSLIHISEPTRPY